MRPEAAGREFRVLISASDPKQPLDAVLRFESAYSRWSQFSNVTHQGHYFMNRATWTRTAIAALIGGVAVALWLLRNNIGGISIDRDVTTVSTGNIAVSRDSQDDLSPSGNAQPSDDVSQEDVDALPSTRISVDLSDVKWRPISDHTDDSEYPPNYDDLKVRAEQGDADAAYFLWQSLQYCQQNGFPPMSEKEYEEETRLIRENYKISIYRDGRRELVDISEVGGSVENAILLSRFQFEQCKNMPLEYRAESERWIDLAVLNGSRAAVSLVAWELSREGDPSALIAMWRSGDSMALNSLSGFFRQQYEKGIDPAGLIKSYAYWLAFRELHYASRAAAGPADRSFFGGIELTTSRYRDELLPGQIGEAEAMAEEILNNRPDQCCTSLDVPK